MFNPNELLFNFSFGLQSQLIVSFYQDEKYQNLYHKKYHSGLHFFGKINNILIFFLLFFQIWICQKKLSCKSRWKNNNHDAKASSEIFFKNIFFFTFSCSFFCVKFFLFRNIVTFSLMLLIQIVWICYIYFFRTSNQLLTEYNILH